MAGDRLEYLLRRPWRDERVPSGVPGVPTMLSKTERRLLYALARDYASEDAAIIDAGCFLGGSTAALLAGIRERSKRWGGPPVASYDLFRVEAYTIPKFFSDDTSVRVGGSFRHLFDAHVAGFDVPHVVHEGDITQVGWSGGPIDVLFLDVLKTWDVHDAVLRDFFPYLVPGRSVIVHQDYGSGWVPWIPIGVELMRDSLRLIDGMEWGSHVFFVEHDLPARLLEEGVTGLDSDTKFELVEQAMARSEGWVRGMIEIGRAELVYERDGAAAAQSELTRIADGYRNANLVLSFIEHIERGLETDGTYDLPARRRWSTYLSAARRRFASTFLGG